MPRKRLPLGFSRNGLSLRLPSSVPEGSTPALREAQKKKRAEEAEKVRERSERKWARAVLRKFGPSHALSIGVPRKIVEAYIRAAEKRRKIEAKKGKSQSAESLDAAANGSIEEEVTDNTTATNRAGAIRQAEDCGG